MPVTSPVITTLTAVGQTLTPVPPIHASAGGSWEVRIDNITQFALLVTVGGTNYWLMPLSAGIYKETGPVELIIFSAAVVGTVASPQVFLTWAEHPDTIPPTIPASAGITTSTVPPVDAAIDWTNVKTYGAIGDGVHDDTPAIAAAIAAVGSGTIYFPRGTYLLGTLTSVDAGLLIPSNITLRGDGAGVSVIQQGFPLPATVEGNTMLANIDDINGNDQINIIDLALVCRVVAGVSPNLTASTLAYRFRGVQDTLIQGCSFDSGTGRYEPLPAQANTPNVNTTGRNHRHKIVGNTFGRGAQAIYFQQGTDLEVSGANIFENAYDSTLSINSSGERIAIVGNIFDKQNNTFLALAHIECTNDGAGDVNGIRDVTIEGNVILNAGNPNCCGVLLQTVQDVSVNGNTIRNNLGVGIRCGVASSKVTISGNTVDVPAGGATGIYLTNDGVSSEITIEGNTVHTAAVAANGIATGGAGSTLTDINIVGNTAVATVNNGIRNDAPVTNSSCSNNVVSSLSQGAGSGWKYENNVGFNPVGHFAAQPAVPASTVAFTNNKEVDADVYVTAGASTCLITLGASNAMTLAANDTGFVRVPAGTTITLTYANAPTWQWFGE